MDYEPYAIHLLKIQFVRRGYLQHNNTKEFFYAANDFDF